MVNKIYALSIFFVSNLALAVTLSPQLVVDRIISQSNQAELIDIKTDLEKIKLFRAESIYDYNLTLESSYKIDRAESLAGALYDKDEILLSKIAFNRRFTLGTDISLALQRIGQRTEFSSFITAPRGPIQSQDILSFSITQPLLRNFLGVSDQSLMEASQKDYDAKKMDRLESLEGLVVDNLRLFWQTLTAQQLLNESISSRDEYSRVVVVIKKKNRLGFANPGELEKVESEFEQRTQQVKLSSINYLELKEKLLTRLKMDSNQDIEFESSNALPPVPTLGTLNVENTRKVRSLKNAIESNDLQMKSQISLAKPTLNFVSKIDSTGVDEKTSKSLSEATSWTHPTYYVGVQFQMNFGSGVKEEEIRNKALAKKSNEVVLKDMREDLRSQDLNFQRKTMALFQVAQSAILQRTLRERAFREVTKGYEQGRTDFNDLISSMNAYFNTQSNATRSIGDYHVALNEWASLRDELIKSDDIISEDIKGATSGAEGKVHE